MTLGKIKSNSTHDHKSSQQSLLPVFGNPDLYLGGIAQRSFIPDQSGKPETMETLEARKLVA